MRILNIDGKTIELYDSIEELPVERFHKFNKMLVIDSGVGSDIASISAKIDRIAVYLEKDRESAMRELMNLKQALLFALSEMDPGMMAFAAMVKSIDGKEQTDITDDGLSNLVHKLSGINRAEAMKHVSDIKKK